MRKIRPNLFVGTLRETQDETYLQSNGIGAVLQLVDSVTYKNTDALFLPVEDGVLLDGATLEAGVAFVRTAQARGKNVLLACGLGVSRSVTFAVAALMKAEGLSLGEAWQAVKEAHGEARPHPLLWRSLCVFAGEEVPYRVVLAR